MKCFKDLGCCLDLNDSWQKTEKVFEELKPYVYQGFENNGNMLYLLDFGRFEMRIADDCLLDAYHKEQSSKKNVVHFKLTSRTIEGFEQKYFEILYFDKEKQIYNLRIYTTFSNEFFGFGCMDFYFQDYDDLESMQKIFFERFSFIGEEK